MKTRYIISGALMALATVGCTDLDVDIKSVYTEYPTDSEIAIEAVMLISPSAMPLAVATMKVSHATLMNIQQSALVVTT